MEKLCITSAIKLAKQTLYYLYKPHSHISVDNIQQPC